MFDPIKAHKEFIEKLSKLDPWNISVHGRDAEAIYGRSEYIRVICDFVSFHIEAMAADADASVPGGACNEEDARGISDIGRDLAGSILDASEEIEYENQK